MRTAVDGIAFDPISDTLAFCALTSHKMYRIKANLLRDFTKTDAELEKAIEDISLNRNFASDGLAYGAN